MNYPLTIKLPPLETRGKPYNYINYIQTCIYIYTDNIEYAHR